MQHTRVQKSAEFVIWLCSQNVSLMNDVDVINTKGGMSFKANLKSKSVIDLAFTTRFVATRWQNLRYIDYSGSDHKMIEFEAVNNSQFIPTSSLKALYNYKKIRWEQFDEEFRIRLNSLIATLIQSNKSIHSSNPSKS